MTDYINAYVTHMDQKHFRSKGGSGGRGGGGAEIKLRQTGISLT